MLRTIIKPRIARSVRSMKKRLLPVRPLEGLPPAVTFEALDGLCREHLGQRLRHCTYVHLSSWKPHGTYRLQLITDAGQKWPLIFKNERYSAADIPALRNLPIRPGPPEFAIYRVQAPQFRRFIPAMYLSTEVEPGFHFQYIMEDLGNTFQRITIEKRDLIAAVRTLLEIQATLKENLADSHDPGLIVYDRRYSESLHAYVRHNLEAYLASRQAPAVEELCRTWQHIVDVHQRDEFHQHRLATPIHGDYNRSNLHVHRRDRSSVKVVDWEWAGIGLPHADLASLLTGVPAANERAALDVFLRAHQALDAESHLRLFRWCRLERRLLDAGYIARQQLASTRQLPWLDKFIAAAAADALRTTRLLAAAPRQLTAA